MKNTTLALVAIAVAAWLHTTSASAQVADAHFHISNYIAQGGTLRQLLQYMNNDNPEARVSRSTVMAIPLVQKYDHWDDDKSEPQPPTYYIGPKAQLYYYSFADAMVAMEYNKLTDAEKERFDPMITGFNPMDLYAVHHIQRALLTFPGVFSGIGEFTVHKEVVTDKLADPPISALAGALLPEDNHHDDKSTLYNPSLKKILDFAAEAGLVVTLHNDIYHTKIRHDGTIDRIEPNVTYVDGLQNLCASSPDANVIWAHTGLGRFVAPAADHLALVALVLDRCKNWTVDISWDLVQQYIIRPQAGQPSNAEWKKFLLSYQDRILYGSDNVFYKRARFGPDGAVIPGSRQTLDDYSAVQRDYEKLWRDVDPAVADKIKHGNYYRLFDEAKRRVRAWEDAHKDDDVWVLPMP